MNKNTTSHMSVTIKNCNSFNEFSCVICGDIFAPDGAIACMEIDGKRTGDVCPLCIEAGPTGAIERQAGTIQWLKSRLLFHAELTDILSDNTPSKWATLGDLRKAEIVVNLTHRGMKSAKLEKKTMDELYTLYSLFEADPPFMIDNGGEYIAPIVAIVGAPGDHAYGKAYCPDCGETAGTPHNNTCDPDFPF